MGLGGALVGRRLMLLSGPSVWGLCRAVLALCSSLTGRLCLCRASVGACVERSTPDALLSGASLGQLWEDARLTVLWASIRPVWGLCGCMLASCSSMGHIRASQWAMILRDLLPRLLADGFRTALDGAAVPHKSLRCFDTQTSSRCGTLPRRRPVGGVAGVRWRRR